MVPSEWTNKRLDELAFVERGKFSARPRNDPKYYGGDIPFVQTGDVSASVDFLTTFSQTLNRDGLKVSKMFPKNAILMTIAANIGDTAITAFDVACPDSVVAVTPIPHESNVYWLKCALDAKKSELSGLATQNAQKNINLQVLRPLLLLTPPKYEQDKIAEIILKWSAAIAVTKKLVANSRAQKKALMQQLLTGKHRLRGFGETWRSLPLRQIARRVQRSAEAQDHPVVMISSTMGFVRQDEMYSRFMAGKSVNDYILLKKGEFAYNKGNSKRYQFGCVFPLITFEEALVPHVYVCFALKPEFHAGFYAHLFEADYLRPQLGRLVNTGVRNNGLLNIKPSDFLGTKVPVPPFREQQAISEVLDTATREINTLEGDLVALRAEKRALMQQLLTGKRRVKLDAAA